MVIVICVLAGFGLLSLLWALFGFLLPGHRDMAVICVDCRGREEAVVRHYGFLRGLGLIRGPLVLIDRGLTEAEKHCLLGMSPDVRIVTWEEFAGQEKEFG